MKTDKELYDFCKGHYYSTFNEEDAVEEETLWEPFENWSVEDVEEQIQNDVKSLKEFMLKEEPTLTKREVKKVIDEQWGATESHTPIDGNYLNLIEKLKLKEIKK